MELLVIIIPAAAVIWFIVSLVRLIRTDSHDTEKYRQNRKMLIASAVTLGVIAAAIVALTILLMLAVAKM